MISTKPSFNWKRVKRNILYDSEYLSLYEDSVLLPDGTLIDDYTVARLPSGVVVVATDSNGLLLAQHEYKYAINKTILNLPSGSLNEGESPVDVARKELLEETGYGAESFELIKTTYEYPSKLSHELHIVRAINATHAKHTKHEKTESIGRLMLISPEDMKNGELNFNTTYNITALALTLPKFISN